MRHQGLLDEVIFKGGTSLRKCALGLQGRFSRDLDFAIVDRAVGELVIDELEAGFAHEGVTFVGFDIDKPAMKGAWTAEAPGLGVTGLACRLDFSTRPLMLPPVSPPRAELPSVNQKDLGFAPVAVHIADLRETCAEKLARFRRVLFARDVYDLHALVPFVRNDLDIIREVLLYKVYFDVVDDGRGTAPFKAGAEFTGKSVMDILDADELGAMTGRRVDMGQMLQRVEATFGTMAPPLSPQEAIIARCSRGDRYRVAQWHAERRTALHHHLLPRGC
jgi:predicted nucleotidyltransferase component of viral defense system